MDDDKIIQVELTDDGSAVVRKLDKPIASKLTVPSLVGSIRAEDDAAIIWSEAHPDWRYTNAWKVWHYWSDELRSWVQDDRLKHMTLMRNLIRGKTEVGSKLRRSASVSGAISLAKSNESVAMSAGEWDSHEMHIGTKGGVVDLTSGEYVKDPKNYLITLQTDCELAPAGAPCPIWESVIADACAGNGGLARYIQKIAGYALSGSDCEQQLFFAYGTGANSKGVLFNTLQRLMGSYAHVANHDLLLASNTTRHPTDLAALRGKRFAVASELPEGARWDEQRLKSITGGDMVSARVMRGDFFTFGLELTLVVFANHKPSFHSVDESVRRRVRLMPFTNTVPPEKRDKGLSQKLEAEWPSILRWMVDGCLMWQEEGLEPPQCVIEASEEYMANEDVLGGFLDDNVIMEPGAWASRKQLWSRYKDWVQEVGSAGWKANDFYSALASRGFAPHKKVGERGFSGLRIGRRL